MNNKWDYQLLTLKDDRWIPDTTLNFRQSLPEFASANISVSGIWQPYYLIKKGPYNEMLEEYEKCVERRSNSAEKVVKKNLFQVCVD